VAELYECFDIDTNHLGHLTKLKQSGTMEDFMVLLSDWIFVQRACLILFFQECFISVLKDEICAHVLMAQP
jgi:hypothetical protein